MYVYDTYNSINSMYIVCIVYIYIYMLFSCYFPHILPSSTCNPAQSPSSTPEDKLCKEQMGETGSPLGFPF